MKTSLRMLIRQILKEAHEDTHYCLGGEVVPSDSIECYEDVCRRIEDAKATRDRYPLQSDARDHYNGILKVLRRKHRKSKKFVNGLNN